MDNISELLRSLVDQYSSIDIVKSEFKRMLNEDDDLKNDYLVWCEEFGYSPRTGYEDFVDEVVASQDSIWDVLQEYDDNN